MDILESKDSARSSQKCTLRFVFSKKKPSKISVFKKKGTYQCLIQDLNLGSSTNVVNFVNVVNLVSDPKYAAAGSGAHCKDPHWGAGVKTLEVNACNGFKLSKKLVF